MNEKCLKWVVTISLRTTFNLEQCEFATPLVETLFQKKQGKNCIIKFHWIGLSSDCLESKVNSIAAILPEPLENVSLLLSVDFVKSHSTRSLYSTSIFYYILKDSSKSLKSISSSYLISDQFEWMVAVRW